MNQPPQRAFGSNVAESVRLANTGSWWFRAFAKRSTVSTKPWERWKKNAIAPNQKGQRRISPESDALDVRLIQRPADPYREKVNVQPTRLLQHRKPRFVQFRQGGRATAEKTNRAKVVED